MKNEITCIVGKLGTGKSTLAKYAYDQYEKALVITSFPQDFMTINIYDLSEISSYNRCCFISDDIIENEIAIRFCYEMGNRLLIIDEAHLYQDSESFKKIMRYSRHKSLDVILISHLLFDFARLNRSLVHNVLSFNLTELYELSYVQRINDKISPKDLKPYEFVVVQGDIPSWLDKKDLTIKENVLKLRL